jgi:hypothetical protein
MSHVYRAHSYSVDVRTMSRMWKRDKNPSVTIIESELIGINLVTRTSETKILKYSFPNAPDYKKSKSSFSVACIGERRNTDRIVMGCVEGKSSLGRPRIRLKKEFKIYLKEIR